MINRQPLNTDIIVSVAKKTNCACAKCGGVQNLCIHHIKPLKHFGLDIPENMILLCNFCHRAVHSNKKELDFYKESKYYSAEEMEYIKSKDFYDMNFDWAIKIDNDDTDHFEILCPKCNIGCSIEKIFVRDYGSLATPPCWYITLKCHRCKIKGQRKMYLNSFDMTKTLEGDNNGNTGN